MDTERPTRTKSRTDNELPHSEASSADIRDPACSNSATVIDEPLWTAPRIDMQPPNRDSLDTEIERPTRA